MRLAQCPDDLCGGAIRTNRIGLVDEAATAAGDRVSDGSCAAGVPERSEGMERKRNSGRSDPNGVRGTPSIR